MVADNSTRPGTLTPHPQLPAGRAVVGVVDADGFGGRFGVEDVVEGRGGVVLRGCCAGAFAVLRARSRRWRSR